jgi:hypothetical protein
LRRKASLPLIGCRNRREARGTPRTGEAGPGGNSPLLRSLPPLPRQRRRLSMFWLLKPGTWNRSHGREDQRSGRRFKVSVKYGRCIARLKEPTFIGFLKCPKKAESRRQRTQAWFSTAPLKRSHCNELHRIETLARCTFCEALKRVRSEFLERHQKGSFSTKLKRQCERVNPPRPTAAIRENPSISRQA